jgi:hypothetical protein
MPIGARAIMPYREPKYNEILFILRYLEAIALLILAVTVTQEVRGDARIRVVEFLMQKRSGEFGRKFRGVRRNDT